MSVHGGISVAIHKTMHSHPSFVTKLPYKIKGVQCPTNKS